MPHSSDTHSDATATDQYRKICEANRVYYQNTARQYESTETCLVDPDVQGELTRDLHDIIALLRKDDPARPLSVLDACGGTGNVSLKLAVLPGVTVTLCDQSPELIAIFKEKSAALSLTCRVEQAEIAAYLAATQTRFDLIVFSSALHHLENYEAVLTLSRRCLSPGGLIYTVFDPIRFTPFSKVLLKVDYYIFKVTCHTRDVFPTLKRKISSLLARLTGRAVPVGDTDWGVLAEYHVNNGIDDIALAGALQARGYQILWHHRQIKARYRLIRWFLKLAQCPTSFKFLLKNETSAASALLSPGAII